MMKLTRMLLLTVFLSFDVGGACPYIARADESFTISTYYPSPTGHYDEVEITNQSVVNDLILTSDASLSAATSIAENGNITTNKLISSSSNYFTRNSLARQLVITGNTGGWKFPTWKQSGWAYKFLGLVTTSISDPLTDPVFWLERPTRRHSIPPCDSNFISAVWNRSAVRPVCIAFPVPPAYIALCTGSETHKVARKCLEITQ